MSEIVIDNIVQDALFEAGDEGPKIEVYRRGPDGPIQLAKVSERNHCPRSTGEIYVSVPSVDRGWSDPHDSSHPAKDVTLWMKLPDGGKRPIVRSGQGEVSWNYDMGFTYCMTCLNDESGVDLGVFDKNDPVASRLVLDTMQFACLSGYCLARRLGVDSLSVVHGKVRYLEYDTRNLELRRAAIGQSSRRSHAGVEATFIKENRPEFSVQAEYRFLYICDRKGETALKVPIEDDNGEIKMRNEHGEAVELWSAM